MKKIAINGFGRIGRLAFRQLAGSEEYEVVAINSRSTTDENAYLLKYDSTHRTWYDEEITYNEEGIIFDGKLIKSYMIDSPKDCPWEELEIDCVLECSGVFTDYDKAHMHIEAGAKHVIISAPGKGDMKTIVAGVNENILAGDEKIISAASCTTNCLAPVVKVINDNFGIESGMMTTVHAYTNDQATLDGVHTKGIASRRGRACAENIVPASTGAAKAIGEVIPQLKGKMTGIALRVPVVNGSCIDLTLLLNKEVTAEEINNVIKSNTNKVLKYTTEPIVSTDIIGNSCGALVDGLSTKVLDTNNKMVKIIAWYDNEWGYTAQMLRTMEVLLKN